MAFLFKEQQNYGVHAVCEDIVLENKGKHQWSNISLNNKRNLIVQALIRTLTKHCIVTILIGNSVCKQHTIY